MDELVNKNAQRVHFSKSLKRKILLDVARGEKLKDIFLKYDFNPETRDKKYLAKLVYKWKQELYNQKEILQMNMYEIDKEILMDEVLYMGNDIEDE